MKVARIFRFLIVCCVVPLIVASIAATLIWFPWSTDPQGDETGKSRNYYAKTYSVTGTLPASEASKDVHPLSEKEQFYVDFARTAAKKAKIPEQIDDFVRKYGLQQKKVLEVGAGSGLLQDAVADYTGLDISPTARRFFHKPFVEASATEMPFPDNTFDGLWTIWVVEHIPNPEKAFLEMRRVTKPGGYMFLCPAFEVSRYGGQGYKVRPYSDFDWKGKLVKASVPVVNSTVWHYLQYHQIRALRYLGVKLGSGPSRLHFTSLTPNYDQYWQADSDAAVSFTAQELYLWFISRGDRCTDCPSTARFTLRDVDVGCMTIQVVKP